MALPYATSQIIRIVTDKVLDNVMKQMAKQQAAAVETPALPAPPSDVASMVELFNSTIVRLQNEVDTLEERLQRLERRQNRLEKRWSWANFGKMTLAAVVICALGFLLAQMFRLGGWMG